MAKVAAVNHAEDRARGGDPVVGPVLDLVHLSRQTFGDHALETELLSLFDRQAEKFAARLVEPSRPADALSRADLAHTLKGSARAVGAFALGDAAEAYETALRNGEPEDTLRGAVVAGVDTVRKVIADLLERL